MLIPLADAESGSIDEFVPVVFSLNIKDSPGTKVPVVCVTKISVATTDPASDPLGFGWWRWSHSRGSGKFSAARKSRWWS